MTTRPMDDPPPHDGRFVRRPSSASGAILALLLAAVPAPAGGQAFTSGRGDLLLAGADGRSVVERPGTSRIELPLPAEARLGDFHSGRAEWWVAAVVHDPGGPAITILKGQGAEVVASGSPIAEPAAEILQPVFVADRDEVHGLVWLAGEAHHRLAVKASRRLGDRWAAPQTVSPPGPGTQIALSAAALDDGSWLLVWAAFDGRDDEILWSRFSNGGWSTPRPIARDNAVPDITPSLVAAGRGALAAWSRFDGNGYRLHVARFSDGAWSEPRPVAPAGSTAPEFSDAPAPTLIYRRADPQGWGVIELDGDGRPVREASLDFAEPERPRIATLTEQGVILEWISLDRQMVSAPIPWVER